MKVAFIGHREIKDETLKPRLELTILNLILKDGADTFIFGSKSRFNDMCYDIVSEYKKIYPSIRRIYLRACYEEVDELYGNYLLSFYEETYFPPRVKGANAASYIQRNREMIDECDLLVTYCDRDYVPQNRGYKAKSGTKLAVEYAEKRGKRIINLFEINAD